MVATDINQVVENYLESPSCLSLIKKNPEIELNVDFDENINKIKGSAPHLSKLIMNLVVNAFDAITSEGSVTIKTDKIELTKLNNGFELEHNAGPHILLSISDTGKGIDQSDLEKIFEPYYSKKKMGYSSGSGLGLSVVYGVVKDHKGYYDIVTEPGVGTEFRIYFPVLKSGEESDIRETVQITGTESILIVDDNEGQRDVATQMVKNLGYNASSVANGKEAVNYLKTQSVDLVLLDMIMEPGMDGLDTYKEILKIYPRQKAIIASGYSATERVEEMQRLGAGQYIRKPYSLNVLGKAIRNELDKIYQTVKT